MWTNLRLIDKLIVVESNGQAATTARGGKRSKCGLSWSVFTPIIIQHAHSSGPRRKRVGGVGGGLLWPEFKGDHN
jgi:hypothetical protein